MYFLCFEMHLSKFDGILQENRGFRVLGIFDSFKFYSIFNFNLAIKIILHVHYIQLPLRKDLQIICMGCFVFCSCMRYDVFIAMLIARDPRCQRPNGNLIDTKRGHAYCIDIVLILHRYVDDIA